MPGSCGAHPTARKGREQVSNSTQLLRKAGGEELKCTETNARITRSQADLTPLKETNKASITDPEEMQIYELFDKEFRIFLLMKFSEL